jgi:hypothetical protein
VTPIICIALEATRPDHPQLSRPRDPLSGFGLFLSVFGLD